MRTEHPAVRARIDRMLEAEVGGDLQDLLRRMTEELSTANASTVEAAQ